ncbi:MAG: 50S ribosomal protein L5 [Candidatus Curtissbacteria bacterium]|nr:50S ribosomal protein L5 [Candidatus Curtissbacteria bacterium]
MASLQAIYNEQVLPKLKEELKLTNNLSVPRIEKVVLNMGLAEAAGNKEVMAKAAEQLAAISGQKPRVTKAKKAISGFSLRQGDEIGLAVTLRGKKAWNFLEKLTIIVLPKMRDFRGLTTDKFDRAGNYSLGIAEQVLFSEVDYSKVDKVRGLVVTIVIKNSDPEKSKKLLEQIGVPFRKV